MVLEASKPPSAEQSQQGESSANVGTHSVSAQRRSEEECPETKEVALRTLEFSNDSSFSQSLNTIETTPTLSYMNEMRSQHSYRSVPRLHVATTSTSHPITIQTSGVFSLSDIPLQTTVTMSRRSEPQPLFVLALSKLHSTPITLAALKRISITAPELYSNQQNINIPFFIDRKSITSEEIQAPDSLTSAPPSYSFVLRQMAARRRPRLMGTFIPSPSFVQHTPPPNYAAAFDIYVDNPMPAPPPRTVNFGFMSMPAVCPQCGYTGLTIVKSKVTLCTHLCAFILCLFCCWLCAPLPYLLRSCKDVYHYCRSCRSFLGMYCPTNPETAYPS